MTDVAVIVPFRNSAGSIAATVEALKAQTVPPARVVLVDDGSTDGGGEQARAAIGGDPRFEILRKEWGGEASALNLGLERLGIWGPGPGSRVPTDEMRATGGSVVLVAIVEADVAPAPDWLERILPAFDDSAVGGAGGTLRGAGGSWIARLAGYEVESRLPSAPADVLHVTSAASIYRAGVFRRLGTFREDLLNASLDSELNGRVRAAGWRLRFVPEARASHRYAPTLGRYLARQLAYARYRRRGGAWMLYPSDRDAALLGGAALLLLVLAVAALLLRPVLAAVPAALACGLFLPIAIRIWIRTRDPAAFGALVLFPLRSLAAAAGMIVECLETFGNGARNPKPG